MNVLYMILGGAVGAAFVSGIFEILKWYLNRRAKQSDDSATSQLAYCAARGEEISGIKSTVEALRVGNRIILYDRIKHLGKTYISQREISAEDLEDIIAMHCCYHDDLEGNGFLDDLMKQVRALPIKIK